ncbi:hypothetical protein E2C01_050934 [Portunus trituberculatus]|uniref:Uncharacterized protein n=1 Tax=Portunus trituberculatus TaxID=210409 RepID=A0A5B7GH99_PORTR|nr:hypothetical protein [Portunus trituberculatus]
MGQGEGRRSKKQALSNHLPIPAQPSPSQPSLPLTCRLSHLPLPPLEKLRRGARQLGAAVTEVRVEVEVEVEVGVGERGRWACSFIWWRESSRSCAQMDHWLPASPGGGDALPQEDLLSTCSDLLLAPTPPTRALPLRTAPWWEGRRCGAGWLRLCSERANLCLATPARVGCSVSGSGGTREGAAPHRRFTSVSRASRKTPLEFGETSEGLESSVIPSTSRDRVRFGLVLSARGAATTTPPAASSGGCSTGAASRGGSSKLSPLDVAVARLLRAAAAASFVRQGVERDPLRCNSRFLVVAVACAAPRHSGEPSSQPEDLVCLRVGPEDPAPRRVISQEPMSIRPRQRDTSTTHDMTARRSSSTSTRGTQLLTEPHGTHTSQVTHTHSHANTLTQRTLISATTTSVTDSLWHGVRNHRSHAGGPAVTGAAAFASSAWRGQGGRVSKALSRLPHSCAPSTTHLGTNAGHRML